MRIDERNKMEINNIYIHDCILEGFNYDYENRQMLLNAQHDFLDKKFTFIFSNVIFLDLQSCSFWGEGTNILCIYLNEDCTHLKKLLQLQELHQNDYRGSQLDRNKKYLEIGIEVNSGDELFIICETVDYFEKSLE